jgi:hypothetical protein
MRKHLYPSVPLSKRKFKGSPACSDPLKENESNSKNSIPALYPERNNLDI